MFICGSGERRSFVAVAVAVVEIGQMTVLVLDGSVDVRVIVLVGGGEAGMLVIVMAVVVAVAMGMGHCFVPVRMGVLVAQDEHRGGGGERHGGERGGAQTVPEDGRRQRDAQEWCSREQRLRSHRAEALGRMHIERDADPVAGAADEQHAARRRTGPRRDRGVRPGSEQEVIVPAARPSTNVVSTGGHRRSGR